VLYAAGPCPTSSRSPAEASDSEGRLRDETVERQLRTLGEEVVRAASRFAADASLYRQDECTRAAERVATAT